MEYNKPNGPTLNQVRHQLGNTVKWSYHYDDRTGNFGYVKDGKQLINSELSLLKIET